MTNETQNETVKESKLVEVDFELPVVESAASAKPRIHMAPGESACTSCEG